MLMELLKPHLEALYAKYNRRDYVGHDPIGVIYPYTDVRDREVVALIASCLAYGRVAQIQRSIATVLDRMTDSPRRLLEEASPSSLRDTFADFKHRFTTGEHLAAMLLGAKRAIEEHGSLCACFAGHLRDDDETVLPSMTAFVRRLNALTDGALAEARFALLPDPEAGSACKRLNLFLRWMVRRDDVDPGGWDAVPASKLIVPLDVHMHRMSLALKLTRRKQANLPAALDVTRAFRAIAPDDPVRYDFALTRLGIHPDADGDAFLRECQMSARPPGRPRT